MLKQRWPKTIVYLQVSYLLYFGGSLINGIAARHTEAGWKAMGSVRSKYDLYAITVLLFCLIVMYGVVRLRRWGRILAVWLNILIVFLTSGMQVVSYLYSRFVCDKGVWPCTPGTTVVAICGISLVCLLSTKNVSSRFL